MNIRFDLATAQYVVDFGTGGDVTTSLEYLRDRQLFSEQTLRTEYYFGSTTRGHSHAYNNECQSCGWYVGMRPANGRHCPYGEF